jgi:hypothetical protein
MDVNLCFYNCRKTEKRVVNFRLPNLMCKTLFYGVSDLICSYTLPCPNGVIGRKGAERSPPTGITHAYYIAHEREGD